jgi:Zn-dependent protease with chaperone function
MDAARFEQVAARFERLSRASPRLYRAVVAALGLLGFGLVALVLVVMLLLLGLTVAAVVIGKNAVIGFKLAVPLGLTLWALLRAVAVKFERPQGIPLEPAAAPALFAELARIRKLGRVPRIHRVVVTPELNAAVAQTPRLGIAGWPHNDLVLGLPMMLSLSPDAFRAVLAHELGHLSGRHGRAGAWVYRVRATWMQVLGALEARRSWLGKVLLAFFRWYGPWFGAASRALAREHERAADRFAASATDARRAADALAAVSIADWAVERRFWPAMMRSTAERAEPPEGYLAGLEAAVRDALADPEAERVLADALLRRSRGADTHPALAERLAALGEAPRVPPASPESAAAAFLGASLEPVRAALDAEWREGVRENWARAHAERSTQARRLAELDDAAAAAPLGAAEAWERASLAEDLRGLAEALPLARDAAARHPDHAPARYGLGRLLLATGHPDGVEHVRRAIALDADAELPGAQLVASFHLARGENELATPWIARAEALDARRERALAERNEMRATDALLPHALADAEVDALVAPVRAHPRVRRAYLARKRLEHFPERDPVYVLAVVPRSAWWKLELRPRNEGLARELANAIPGDARVFVFVKGESNGSLFRRVKKLPRAQVA